MRHARIPLMLALTALWACGGDAPPREPDEPSAPAEEPRPPVPGSVQRSVVVVLGTSLTAGMGLSDPAEESWVAGLQALADSAGIPVEVRNAGVSGDTSAGGLRRLEWLLRDPMDVLVVELGANDGLRGLELASLEENLTAMVEAAREANPAVRVAFVAMEAPPNLGGEYTARFREVFPRVAGATGAVLVPFPMDGVAGVGEMNQADGIHPTAEGHALMARNAWPWLEPVLRAAAGAEDLAP